MINTYQVRVMEWGRFVGLRKAVTSRSQEREREGEGEGDRAVL